MYRGTTPTNIFNVDVDLTEATEIYITYAQRGKPVPATVLEKSRSDLTVTDTQLTVKLTQEDTLKFVSGEVSIQIRAKFSDGTAIASNIIKTTADIILKEGAI